jgi:hypothetical protein
MYIIFYKNQSDCYVVGSAYTFAESLIVIEEALLLPLQEADFKQLALSITDWDVSVWKGTNEKKGERIEILWIVVNSTNRTMLNETCGHKLFNN